MDVWALAQLPAYDAPDFGEDGFELFGSGRAACRRKPPAASHAIAMSPESSLPLLPVLSPIFHSVGSLPTDWRRHCRSAPPALHISATDMTPVVRFCLATGA